MMGIVLIVIIYLLFTVAMILAGYTIGIYKEEKKWNKWMRDGRLRWQGKNHVFVKGTNVNTNGKILCQKIKDTGSDLYPELVEFIDLVEDRYDFYANVIVFNNVDSGFTLVLENDDNQIKGEIPKFND